MQDDATRLEHRQLDMQATYMQFSKKIAVAAIVAWVVSWATAMAVLVFTRIDIVVAEALRSIVAYSATLTGAVVVGYMGNSGIEKYARFKFDYDAARRDTSCDYQLRQQQTYYTPTITKNSGPSEG